MEMQSTSQDPSTTVEHIDDDSEEMAQLAFARQAAAQRKRRRLENEDIEVASQNYTDDANENSVHDGLRVEDGWEVPIEPFHMKNEMSEGAIDEEGNFILNRQKKQIQDSDAWLDSLDIREGSTCFENEEERLRIAENLEKSMSATFEKVDMKTEMAILKKHLQKDETPLQALQRLKKYGVESQSELSLPFDLKSVKKKKKTTTKFNKMSEKTLEVFHAITTACDQLVVSGMSADLFFLPYQKIKALNVNEYNSPSSPDNEELVSSEAASSNDCSVSQEYMLRWMHNPDEIHGPFSTKMLQDWIAHGYFSSTNPAELAHIDGRNSKNSSLTWKSWELFKNM